MVDGLEDQKLDEKNSICEACIYGKQHRTPNHEEIERATGKLDRLHSDLAGPFETSSIGGSKYILTFTDDAIRKVWVYFLKAKSKVFETFRTWKAAVELESGQQIKRLRTDKG